MKRLLVTTTAIVTMAATPMMAQAESTGQAMQQQTGAQTAATSQSGVAGSTEQTRRITADHLLGKAVYVAPKGTEDARGQDGSNEAAAAQGGTGQQMGDESGEQAANESDWDMDFTEVPENWEHVGNIEDLVISRDGKVSAVVIDSGEFFDLEEKRVRVEMNQLRFIMDKDDRDNFFVRYTGDRDRLQSQDYDEARSEQDDETLYSEQQTDMAAMDGEGVPGPGDETSDGRDSAQRSEDGSGMTQTQGSDQARDTQGSDQDREGDSMATATGAAGSADERNQDEARRTAEQAGEQDMARNAADNARELSESEFNSLSVERLEDSTVYGSNGEWVGEVADVVLDGQGKATHVIVDVGGFLGIGEKPVAFGFDDINVRRHGEDDDSEISVQLSKTEEELERMDAHQG